MRYRPAALPYATDLAGSLWRSLVRRPLIAPLALIAGLASLASASPALADTPPVLPVISVVGTDPNDAGYLDFHATSDSAIDPASVTAQLTFRVSGERPVTTVTGFTLVSGTPQDGTWRTTARMALGSHGDYDAVVDLADADGTRPTSAEPWSATWICPFSATPRWTAPRWTSSTSRSPLRAASQPSTRRPASPRPAGPEER
ncbi:MAG: hypothetical protein JWO67_6102, partial [Streptosporangiaceae bacterium]|nr:hypothetical protein [Streptosporangiaceae bacterium]